MSNPYNILSSNRTRAIIASLIATIFESYDVMLYVHFLFVITPVFFPHEHMLTSKILGLMSLSISFVTRPLGGAIFGYLGDRFGRKSALTTSILFMTFPTVLIGILPNFQTLGILSPILVIVARLVQGFSLGGEMSCANVFIVEYAPPKYLVLFGSFLNVGCWVGGILATILGYICMLPTMPSWAWRIPFILGGAISIAGYYIRKNIKESPVFLYMQKNASTKTVNNIFINNVIKDYKKILCIIGLCAGVSIPLHTVFLLFSNISSSMLNISASQVMWDNCLLMLMISFLTPYFAYLGDLYGPRKIMTIGGFFLIPISIILFTIVDYSMTPITILYTKIIILILGSTIFGPICSYLTFLFHPSNRCQGIGIGWSLGLMVFSLMQVANTYLIDKTGRIVSLSITFTICMSVFLIALKKSSNFCQPQYIIGMENI